MQVTMFRWIFHENSAKQATFVHDDFVYTCIVNVYYTSDNEPFLQ